jgi:hypothetical protein
VGGNIPLAFKTKKAMKNTEAQRLKYTEQKRLERIQAIPTLSERKNNIEEMMILTCHTFGIAIDDLRKLIVDEGFITSVRLSQLKNAKKGDLYNDLTDAQIHYFQTLFRHLLGQKIKIENRDIFSELKFQNPYVMEF